MNKLFNTKASEMTVGQSLVFTGIITIGTLALMGPIFLVIAICEGTVELPKPKIPEKLKNLKRRYIDVAADDSREDKED